MGKLNDLTGMKFGRLMVLHRGESHRYPSGLPRVKWNCICDCGNEISVNSNSLKSGNTSSCGCLQIDLTIERSVSHGLTKTSEYRVWQNAKRRCVNHKSKDFEHYGGRGIKMCERWTNSFENFLNDMGKRPEGMTLERTDVNKDYSPENCKWATMKEQCNNRTNNRWIEWSGERKTLQQWADIIGVHSDKVRHRLNKGKTINEIFQHFNNGKSYPNNNSKNYF